MGIYIFSPDIRAYLPPNQYLDLADLIQLLIQYKKAVFAYNNIDHWLDIGRHDDYQEAQSDFTEMRHLLMPDDL